MGNQETIHRAIIAEEFNKCVDYGIYIHRMLPLMEQGKFYTLDEIYQLVTINGKKQLDKDFLHKVLNRAAQKGLFTYQRIKDVNLTNWTIEDQFPENLTCKSWRYP